MSHDAPMMMWVWHACSILFQIKDPSKVWIIPHTFSSYKGNSMKSNQFMHSLSFQISSQFYNFTDPFLSFTCWVSNNLFIHLGTWFTLSDLMELWLTFKNIIKRTFPNLNICTQGKEIQTTLQGTKEENPMGHASTRLFCIQKMPSSWAKWKC